MTSEEVNSTMDAKEVLEKARNGGPPSTCFPGPPNTNKLAMPPADAKEEVLEKARKAGPPTTCFPERMTTTETSTKMDDKAVLDKARKAATKVGDWASRHSQLTCVLLMIAILYLQIPTLLIKGCFLLLGKPMERRPVVPTSVPMDQVLKEVPEQLEDPLLNELKEQFDGEEDDEDYVFVGPLTLEDYKDIFGEYIEEIPNPCQEQGLVLLTGATGSVGSQAAHILLAQGFCVRVFTESLQQARAKLNLTETAEDNLEWVEGLLGDGESMAQAFEPRESSGYAPVTHVLFAAASSTAGNQMDAVHHRGVEECAAAAAEAGTVQSMVVMSAAWVSKPYSLASLLYNGLYDNLPSAKHWEGEDAMRTIAAQHEQECDAHNQNNNETAAPLNYVILRSGRVVADEDEDTDADGIGLAQDDSFDFWGPAGAAPGMSHSQLAQAAVAALQVQGKYTVEVTRGSTPASEAHQMFSTLLQDDEAVFFNPNQTVTLQDVEQVHAQALTDLINVLFTLVVGTVLLVALLGPGQGLFLSMTLYTITIWLWTTYLSDRTVWDCLASEMPRKLPLLHVPGVSFASIPPVHHS